MSSLIRCRSKCEWRVQCVSEANIPTQYGNFAGYVYHSTLDHFEHLVLVKGEINSANILVRIHSECLTGDVFGSMRCDCGSQLQLALQKIAQEGRGIIIYLKGQEGRGIGLGNKLRAYHLQEQGLDTVEANEELGFPVDSREYEIGAKILEDLGVTTIRLLTNNPDKYNGLENCHVKIIERVPLLSEVTKENYQYLQTKKNKLGHLLDHI